MAKQAKRSYAWGLEIGGSAVRLARLMRGDDGGFAVDAWHHAPLADDDAPALAEALASLPMPPAAEPLAVCLADDAVLYRRLELPAAADPEALDQMVRAQMEVLLPLPPAQLVWGWARTGDGGNVLLCAARREAADRLADAGAPRPAALTLPSALAAGAALRRFFTDPHSSVVMLDVAAQTTTLLILGPHGPRHVATTAAGGDTLLDEAEAGGDALAAWQREVSAAYRQTVQELGESLAPGRCILIGRGSQAPELERAAAQATGLPVAAPERPRGLTLPSDAPMAEVLPAVGAALHVLSPPEPAIVLGDGLAAPGRAGRPTVSKRALAAAAVIVAALFGLYQLDMRYASRLEASTESTLADADQRREMAQALALGDYLQDQPPPPLLALEALSESVSERLLVKEWKYDRQGRFRVGGTVGSVGEMDQTLTRLTAAPPFDDVELRSASVERNTWTFEVEAALMPLHRYIALSAQQRSAAPEDDADSKEAADGNE